jgi:hypothetical protein
MFGFVCGFGFGRFGESVWVWEGRSGKERLVVEKGRETEWRGFGLIQDGQVEVGGRVRAGRWFREVLELECY